MVHMRNVEKQELITQMIRKMAPPLGKSKVADAVHSDDP
jgi:hypothetical protein